VSEVLIGWWKGLDDGAEALGWDGVVVGVVSEVFGSGLSVGFFCRPQGTSGQKTEQRARRRAGKRVEVGCGGRLPAAARTSGRKTGQTASGRRGRQAPQCDRRKCSPKALSWGAAVPALSVWGGLCCGVWWCCGWWVLWGFFCWVGWVGFL